MLAIRPAIETDLNALCDLYIEFHEYHAQHLPDYLTSLGKLSAAGQEELGQKILEIISGPDSILLLADLSGVPVGFAELYIKHTEPQNTAVVAKVYAHLQSLSVSEGME